MFIMNSLVIVILFLNCYDCFNLEYRIPIIKVGAPGSYFGYSVAEHQIFSEDGKPQQNL